MNTKHDVELPAPILTARGEFGAGLAELVARKVATIARHAHEPVLAIRVELDRRAEHAVTAGMNVDFNGRQIHATGAGRTAAHAVDVAMGRVVRQMDDRPHARRWRRR